MREYDVIDTTKFWLEVVCSGVMSVLILLPLLLVTQLYFWEGHHGQYYWEEETQQVQA